MPSLVLPSGSTPPTFSRGRCPPPPPDGFRAELLTSRLHFNPEECVRIGLRGRDPLAFGRNPKGNRFDPLASPWESTNVLYVATRLEAAIGEAIFRWHGQITLGDRVILSEATILEPRTVVRIKPKRTLTLIDATGLGLGRIDQVVSAVAQLPSNIAALADAPKPLADDIFQCSAAEYVSTQKWGAWFRSQSPDADGIMWVSRQFNVGSCIVLFEDRCGSDLELLGSPTPLYAPGSAERALVNKMVGQLRWGLGP